MKCFGGGSFEKDLEGLFKCRHQNIGQLVAFVFQEQRADGFILTLQKTLDLVRHIIVPSSPYHYGREERLDAVPCVWLVDIQIPNSIVRKPPTFPLAARNFSADIKCKRDNLHSVIIHFTTKVDVVPALSRAEGGSEIQNGAL